MRSPLSSRHPWLYALRVRQRQMFRHLRWHFGPERFATTRNPAKLACKVYRHQSKLRRLHGADPAEALWQDNKVTNHRLAIACLDGVIIAPGETLSLWRLIGPPTPARGFVEGMELHQGQARGGIGGGLCQIANLVHWLALHSPLRITARANHSFDPFPDQGRLIPYGTGAALFWNYIDLWVFNPTDQRFQLRLWLTDSLINGELRCDQRLEHRYRIEERAARFTYLPNGQWLRENEIWRQVFPKGGAVQPCLEERLYRNRVRVLYEPQAIETKSLSAS